MSEGSPVLPSQLIRRALAVVTSAATLVGASLVAAAPASAAYGECKIIVPSKVTINSPYREIPLRFTNSCYDLPETAAYWTLVHPTKGPQDFAMFSDYDVTSSIDRYDWETVGRMTWRAEGAEAWESWGYDDWDNEDGQYIDLYQNQPVTDFRYGSRASISGATRSGRYVKLSASASKYSWLHERYQPWGYGKFHVDTKSCSSCAWKYVKTVTASRTGRSTITVPAATKRNFRVRTAVTASTWGATSQVVYR